MARANDSPDLQGPRGDVRDEALSWFVRMNSGDATEADRARHASWLAADPRHRSEYARLGGIWRDLDALRDPRQITQMPAAPRALSRRMVLSGSMAAGLVGGYVSLNGLPDFLRSTEHTGTGETRRAVLEDGSTVDLDAETAFALEFDDQVRGLHLQRGRALFDIAPDPRPFSVRAEGGTITALGTRFSVHLWDGSATVAVEQHAVTLQTAGLGEIQLEEGERISFGNGAHEAVEPFDAEIQTAWLRGKLIFEDRPLRQVLADVNRYRRGTIQVTSARLLDMRVSGIFDIANPDGVLEAIENTLPVRSTHVTRYLVVLRPA
ncbi:FecR family protein (plasmid) [Cereibacter sphaeroides]|uniref:FecR family protein n=1 Tax=Cereibacter sphaeroides TaxID=1063 RepID=UPI000F545514|nr:FecR family protein [Cereibacter sphaeroides]AZB57836.1 FecR family protein [Cereibacter sphaeroides]